MKMRRLPGSDLTVSEICLGTMTFGEQNTASEAAQQLNYALAQGVNFIDTAEMYPVPPRAETQGLTEDYVGRWLCQQPRDRVVLASKVTGPARGFEWIRGGPRINRQHIVQAVNGSLERLRTDVIDLYQIHWPDRNVPMFGQRHFDPADEREATPIVEQLEVFADLIAAGKIRYLGLSNETPWGLARFIQLAEHHDLPRPITIQNAYNLLNRCFENGLDETCFHSGTGLLAYSPLAFGLLSGKYRLPGASGRITLFPGFGQRYDKPNVDAAVAEYAVLAEAHGLSPAQMALAFVRGRWFTASTIISATTLQQLVEDIDSHRLTLSDELLAAIDSIHRRYPNPAP